MSLLEIVALTIALLMLALMIFSLFYFTDKKAKDIESKLNPK
jgi:hypothetical protein